MALSRGFHWNTPAGHTLIQRILVKRIPEWTYGLRDWQLPVVAQVLDGDDVFCITATGDGKSALFMAPIMVRLEVADNPALYPDCSAGYKGKTPLGLVVAPTKGLAHNIVHELKQHRVSALAYTAETITEARKSGVDLAAEISACRWSIVVLDPEHLNNKDWERIVDSPQFRENIFLLCVDEAHLINEWGPEFRPCFLFIGTFVRGRLPAGISILALTATLCPGSDTNTVCRSLGFQRGLFRMHRRSNERSNIQFSLVPLTHTLGGHSFPDLIPYLGANRKTVIYCATIELCFRVFVYLLRLLPPGPRRLKRVRLYHAMCWTEENETTVRLIRDDPECQVIVATVAFGLGFNVKPLLDSIQLGLGKTVNMIVQEAGRVGRGGDDARAVVLAQKSVYKSAKKFLQDGPAQASTARKASKALARMDRDKAQLLTTTKCLVVFLNESCMAIRPPTPILTVWRRIAAFPAPTAYPMHLSSRHSSRLHYLPVHAPRPKYKLTRVMRNAADASLLNFRLTVEMSERDSDTYGVATPSSYLPAAAITTLLDNFQSITSTTDLIQLLPKWKFHQRHASALLTVIQRHQTEFHTTFKEARLLRNEKARLKRAAERAAGKETAGEAMEADSVPVSAAMAEEMLSGVRVGGAAAAASRPKPRPIVKRKRAETVLEPRTPLDETTNRQQPKKSRKPLQTTVASSKHPYNTRRTHKP